MENIIDVANYIMSKKYFTPKQVQKIMYYAYSLYLVKYNDKYSDEMNKLFDGEFEAWKHGPVNRMVYNYIKNRYGDLTKEKIRLKEKQNENFLDKVILVFGRYSGNQLENMTKLEEPWLSAYTPQVDDNPICTNKISDKVIYDYFHRTFIEDK